MFNKDSFLRFLLLNEDWLTPEEKAEADRILAMDKNSAEYKKAFRQFAKKYHPDRGYKSDAMKYFNSGGKGKFDIKKDDSRSNQTHSSRSNQAPPPTRNSNNSSYTPAVVNKSSSNRSNQTHSYRSNQAPPPTRNSNNSSYTPAVVNKSSSNVLAPVTKSPSNKAAKETENKPSKKNKHIGAKIAAGAAGTVAVAAAGKAIHNKSKYKKYLRANGLTARDLSYKEWKAGKRATSKQAQALDEAFDCYYEINELNEALYETLYESFDDIDEYDLEEIRYYAEKYEELDRIYLEEYYDNLVDLSLM